MVWGAFSRHHKTALHIFRRNVTGESYRDDVLQPIVEPFFQAHQDLDIFQHDNARPHRARVAADFLQQANIEVMSWPALSPDMSPIEHAWDELGRHIRSRSGPAPATLEELADTLTREWNAIPQETFSNLVLSMRRRCNACIAAAGGHTRY